MTEDSFSQALLTIGGGAVFLFVATFLIAIILAPLSMGCAAKLLKVPDRSVLKAIGSVLVISIVSLAVGALSYFSPSLPGGNVVVVQLFFTTLNLVVGPLISAGVISTIYKTAFGKSLSIALLFMVLHAILLVICTLILFLGASLILRNM